MTIQTDGEAFPESCDPSPHYRDMAALLYRERRSRDTYLPAARGLWSDPAWDMLLDLFIANEDGKPVSVSSACIGACLAPTTGLRWIKQLIGAGLVTRSSHPSDGRKGMLSVTDEAAASIRNYIDNVGKVRAAARVSLRPRSIDGTRRDVHTETNFRQLDLNDAT